IPLQLSRLTKRQAQEMVAALAPGHALPEPVADLIATRADGIPLYVEELARTVLESGRLVERDGQWQLATADAELAIPAAARDSLGARLEHVGMGRGVAQRAAVLGREFAYDLLARTAERDERTVQQGLARLVEAELLFQRGEPPAATYTFKHALIQEAA